jgi:Protein of unknown function (DUF2934)
MSKHKSPSTTHAVRTKTPAHLAERSAPQAEVTASSLVDTNAARQKMIAEAAFYRAEKRGFVPGCELEDWLAAEVEVSHSALEQQAAPLELY